MANSYTAKQFIKAMAGTGGVISAIADNVGCSWHTAKKYIEEYSTVNEAWIEERNRITDKARNNIIKAIERNDLQMSKWWLQVMDEEFVPREKREVSGIDGGKIIVSIED
jgi:5'-3' exonuclease